MAEQIKVVSASGNTIQVLYVYALDTVEQDSEANPAVPTPSSTLPAGHNLDAPTLAALDAGTEVFEIKPFRVNDKDRQGGFTLAQAQARAQAIHASRKPGVLADYHAQYVNLKFVGLSTTPA